MNSTLLDPTPEAVLAGVTGVAREHLQWQGPVRPEMHLVEDLGLDSLRLLTLAVEIENHFRVILDDADEETIETVGDLVATISDKLATGEAE
ncbi:MAG: acyl carrier protein [Acidobacteriota bacterium]